jgi:hypothetical protein
VTSLSSLDSTETAQRPRRFANWLRPALSLAIIALTLGFLGLQLARSWDQVSDRLRAADLRLIAFSALLYGLGLALLGWPWTALLGRLAPAVTPARRLAVYLISHAGKYVPGKAMVFIIRAGLLAPRGVGAGEVTAVTFQETFLSMGSGALLGLLAAGFAPAELMTAETRAGLALLAGGLAAGFLVASFPTVFRRLTRIAALPFRKAVGFADQPAPTGLWLMSIVTGLIAWLIQGTGLALTILALDPQGPPLERIPLVAAAFALSSVAGFLSGVPGQLGVRDWVLLVTLGPLVSPPTALAAPVVFRIVTLAVELSLALALAPWSRR